MLGAISLTPTEALMAPVATTADSLVTAAGSPAQEEAVRTNLLAEVAATDDIEAGRLISTVAQQLDEDFEIVTKAMWDLVDAGELRYGADARVRASTSQHAR